MYMQLGCFALDEIIQVSDHAVAPSFGHRGVDGHLRVEACRVLAITCQLVPEHEAAGLDAASSSFR